MEELQLTLTPARVDQRNFGLMLSNWRVGTMLTALVVDRMPNGGALLSIGGRQFIATTDIPVQPGSRIQLEVQMLTPNLVLKVADGTSQSTASSQPVPVAQPMAANPLIAGQAASAAGLLNAIAGDASLRALLNQSPQLARLVAQIQASVLTPSSVSATIVRQAVNQSGLFNETNLRSSRTGNLQQATKTTLQTMQQLLIGEIERLGMQKMTGVQGQLSELVEAALSALTQQQIKSLPSDAAPQRWFTSIPISIADQFYNLDISIMQDEPKSGAEEEASTWQACIALELPELGALEVEI
ncbi:MAG: hypothetical protein L7S45_08245, partial [Luminiphilus sp.]|nr:hypothetical protein [Luminiphilus sp.]